MHERRQHQRYSLEMDCFLTYATSVGTIIDICMGGMFCMCLEANKFEKESPEKGADIVCGKAMLLAQNLPLKVLNSNITLGEFAREVKVRKCRLRFQHLEHYQQNQLEDILLSHARRPVASKV